MGLFLESDFYSSDKHMSMFMAVSHCFDYCSFVLRFEIRKSDYCFDKIVLAIPGPLQFHMSLKIHFSISAIKVTKILIGSALNLWMSEEYCHFNNLRLPIYAHEMSFIYLSIHFNNSL